MTTGASLTSPAMTLMQASPLRDQVIVRNSLGIGQKRNFYFLTATGNIRA
jgi:hypothetical protein